MSVCTKCNKEYVSADGICPYCKESIQNNTEPKNVNLVASNKKTKKLKSVFFVIIFVILIACLLISYNNKKSKPKASTQNKMDTVATDIQKKEIYKTETPKKEPSAKAFSIGKINEKTYVNEYFNFGCTLNDEWTYSDQNELFNEYISSDGEIKIDSNIDLIIEAIQKNGIYVDMHADVDNSISSINVVVEFNDKSATYSSEKALLKQINSEIESHYKSMNANVSMCEVESVPFGNNNKYALHTRLSFNGTDFETYQYVFIVNNYSATLTLTSNNTENLNSIAKKFYII